MCDYKETLFLLTDLNFQKFNFLYRVVGALSTYASYVRNKNCLEIHHQLYAWWFYLPVLCACSFVQLATRYTILCVYEVLLLKVCT